VSDFYDDLAPFYRLIYADWYTAIGRQAGALDEIIRQHIGAARTVLDVSCGIGTQCLGLAEAGYQVTASDLSFVAVERATVEASAKGLSIDFSVADMRHAFDHHGGGFDVVVSGDNSVPHLLSDADISVAFTQFLQCLRRGGLFVMSVRDYAAIDRMGVRLMPIGVRHSDGRKYALLQLWEFDGPIYDLTLFIVEDEGGAECRTHAFRTRYYAILIPRLIELLEQAGFEDVKRIDERFFQPVLVGRRPSGAASP
jgi:SAM-dependent methyltransferase